MNILTQSEYEVIEHKIIKNFQALIVDVIYRTAHIHSDFEVAFLVQGSAAVICNGVSIEINAPDFFVVNPLCAHEVQANGTATFLTIQVLPSFFLEYYPSISQIEFEFCSGASALNHPEKPYFSRILKFAASIARHYFKMEKGFSLYCAGKLNHLFYDLLQLMPYRTISPDEQKKHEQYYSRLRKISAYIHENYDKKLLLSDIAKEEGLTMTYLSHFFKDYFRMSFQEYLMRLRIEKARQLVLMTGINMMEICMECGFSDTKYLNRNFMKIYGISPKELRRKGEDLNIEAKKSFLSNQHFLLPHEALKRLNALKI